VSSEVASPIDPLIGKVLMSRFVLEKPLGSGGMGAVYLAHDQTANQRVALKLLSQSVLSPAELEPLEKRLQREVHLLSALQASTHPARTSIVSFYEMGRDAEVGLFYTMEWVKDALPLMDFLQTHALSVEERLAIGCQILDALSVLHRQKVLHRDLKSSNVLCSMIDGEPRVTLIDLGIARWFSDVVRTHMTVETAPGAVLGSPAYMAPEMWRNEDVDARTDVYQVAILLFQMLTERLPYEGTPMQLMFQHLHGTLPPLDAHLPASINQQNTSVSFALLDGLLAEATSLDPTLRPVDAEDMLGRLRALLPVSAMRTDRPGSSLVDEHPSEMQQRRTRRSVSWLLWVLVWVVSGLLLLGPWLMRREAVERAPKPVQTRVAPQGPVRAARVVPVRRVLVPVPRRIKKKATSKSIQRPVHKKTGAGKTSQKKPRRTRQGNLQKPGFLDTLLEP
jgi:serine/threonine protein kinase